MPQNINKTKKPGHILIWQYIHQLKNIKIINYFNNLYFSTYFQNFTQKTKLKSSQTLFDRTQSNLTSFFYQITIKYFNDLQNRNFSVLRLK